MGNFMIKIIQTGPFGVNSLVVPLTENKVFVVDPACCKFCGDEAVITDFLEQNSLECVAIILTHGHFDHISGINILKEKFPNAKVLISKKDSFLIGKNSQKAQENILSLMGFSSFLPSVSNLCESDSFLEDEKTLFDCFGKFPLVSESLIQSLKEWLVIETPGHTFGSVCLFNKKQNILISGDTLFYKSWGRCDLGGSEKLLFESLQKLKNKIPLNAKVFPGHEKCNFDFGEDSGVCF